MGEGRTVESEVESESFLPASLVIHSSLGSVEGDLLLMPGTTRGMIGCGCCCFFWRGCGDVESEGRGCEVLEESG